MRQLLITIAAVVLVGCGESQQSATAPEAKEEPPTAEAIYHSLFQAAVTGDIEEASKAIVAGADVNAKGKEGVYGDGTTPLWHAASGGENEMVELLIAKGADINLSAKWMGTTSLHEAALSGHKKVVELLIAAGADVNAKVSKSDEKSYTRHLKDGQTPLDSANWIFEFEHSPEEIARKKAIAELLRKHGAKTGEELKAEGK